METKHNKPSSDWRSLTIYQIMVGSFLHGEGGAEGYDSLWGPAGERKDGNLQGVIQALDHIVRIGANAIWLTPIFDSSEADGGEKLQATGYFANNYFKIDPHFGTEDDLRELVEKAHERGIYVFLDGVFGHHGGVNEPSPSGFQIDSTPSLSDRGEDGGTGNVKYPESLDYFKEVATYWIDKFDIDGWRFDQAYQLCQNGHNYWCEISQVVREICDKRRNEGKEWGILGYMVGEDWSDAGSISSRIFRDGGLKSAFDFDGKQLISGSMNGDDYGGLDNGWDDIMRVYSSPADRGYAPDDVLPNLFLTNHDGVRVADSFYDDNNEINLMTRFAILAGYNGPITLYYGDEFADLSRDCEGSQSDNASRTSGHLKADDDRERRLLNYVCDAMTFRRVNPAMWRGRNEFDRYRKDDAEILVVIKTDDETGNRVAMIFSDRDADVTLPGEENPRKVRGYIPELIKLA
ncbi:alpha-amylase family glycosyl hydrolase [uncultured Muribaculum sp.]|uniref:alpha-amylase family glycosyl hydrolase n=1 Tax=uncultured Muribaculum sp. TaxID=1918613 RepID=UPI0025B67B4B|nr:alpha-amylase family glycosyl hydrolase [uncultured Muribaculum sp.]